MFPETKEISFASSSDSFGAKSYLFDFDTGDFVVRDGKLIECDGLKAVKIWIEKILRTEKTNRQTGEKKYGYIVIPVIIPDGMKNPLYRKTGKEVFYWFLFMSGRNGKNCSVSGFLLLYRLDQEVVFLASAEDEEFAFDEVGDGDVHGCVGDAAVVDVDTAFLDTAAGFTL